MKIKLHNTKQCCFTPTQRIVPKSVRSAIPVVAVFFIVELGILRLHGSSWIRAEGTLQHQVVDSKGAITHNWNKTFVSMTSVSGCQWYIQTADPMGEEGQPPRRVCEIAFADDTMYRLFRRQGTASAAQTTKLSGGMRYETIPRDDGRLANYVWVALASSCYLAQQTNTWIHPIWEIDDTTLRSKGFRMEALWESHTDNSPPDRVVWLNDGVDRMHDADGVSIERPAPPPYDEGYTNAIYRVESHKDIGGIRLPLSFSFVRYVWPLKKLDPTNTLGVVPRTVTLGKVSSLNLVSGPESILPGFQQDFKIVDTRFAESNPPVPALTYEITNGTWPETEQVAHLYEVSAEASGVADRKHGPAKEERDARSIAVRIILTGTLTALIIVIYILGRRSPIQK